VLPEGFRYSFDGNMRLVGETAKQVWKLEKQVEELQRLSDVSQLGSTFERARADENKALLRMDIEKNRQEAMENLKRGVGALDDLTVEGLDKGQRDELAKQVAEQKAKLDQLQTKLEMQDRETSRGAFANDFGDGDFRGAREQVLDSKELAEKQAEQQYRFAGKRNAGGRAWTANTEPGTDNDLPGQEMKPQTEEPALVQGAVNRLLETGQTAQTYGLFAVVPLPQTVVPGQAFEGDATSRAPSGGSGFAFGVSGVSGGAGGAGASYGWRGDGGGGTFAPPETRAGLLSLPVHVPMQGQTFRFEKLNGGAKLEVSVGTPGAGRAPLALGIFLAVAAVLLALARFLRR
jgi:hypothetical protein